MAVPWQVLSAAEALSRLGVDPAAGLSSAEVERRRLRYGSNELQEQGGRSALAIAVAQLADAMIVLLVLAAIVSALLGDGEDAIVIVAVVVLNGVIGFTQEYHAERAVQALKRLAAAHARVLRAGSAATVPEREVVPGDIVLLEAGAVVPADLRLIEVAALRIEEAVLTGEAHPADKETTPLPNASLALGDRANMAFKGTLVANGRGIGVAVDTGMQTEFGRIAAQLSQTERLPTPLQRRLARFGRQISLAAIAICVFVFLAGALRGEPVLEVFLTAVSLAVAAVPEALPVVVNVALALGAQRMVKEHVLVRHLSSVETLGSVTYICSDKTGTLTQNRLAAEALVTLDGRRPEIPPELSRHEPWCTLLSALALNNDVVYDPKGVATGDPTEIALDRAAREAGFLKNAVAASSPRIAELPFDSDRKLMTTLHRRLDGGIVGFTKGAPERVLERCTSALGHDGVVAADTHTLRDVGERLADEGLRVLAFAYRDWTNEPGALAMEAIECDLTFLGFVGLIDPPRPEAEQAVAECRSAGIVPVMITGDHPLTARRIAARLGIIDGNGIVMTGQELKRIDAGTLADEVRRIRVYARVDPEQKIAIVEALQRAGEIVAMTGDGVNDAPALKRADVGVAMGKFGTDAAREASHIVLTDDNFASIVAAVREGRRIFENIRKFTKFVIAGNIGEILTVLLPPFFGLPLALAPIQILWINLITDGLPGIALAAEPAERGIMHDPPRRTDEGILSENVGVYITWTGLLIGALTIGTQAYGISHGIAHWQTMVFTTLTLAQIFQVITIRVARESVIGPRFCGNPAVLLAVAVTCALQLAAIYMPFFNRLLNTQSLTAGELGACFGISAIVFFAVELDKLRARTRSALR